MLSQTSLFFTEVDFEVDFNLNMRSFEAFQGREVVSRVE